MKKTSMVLAFVLVYITNTGFAANRYTLQALPLPPLGTNSQAEQINNSGQIVGAATVYEPHTWNGGYESYACLWEPTGEVILIVNGGALGINDNGLVLGGTYTWDKINGFQSLPITLMPRDINISGQIVGVTTNNNITRCQNGINDLGQIVGRVDNNTTGVSESMLWFNGQEYPIELYDAFDINNAGQIIGITDRNGGGVLLDKGNTVSLNGQPIAINNIGQIITTYYGTYYLWEKGEAFDITSLLSEYTGWSNLRATDINDNGQIVGRGFLNGSLRGFMMNPVIVPEPFTLLLMGMGGLAIFQRRPR